ncbi:ABC-type Na+ efflux pump permease subunit [Methanomicrobium sp. W14]|uniref:ABC transporter permease n=1 Tax=Methanomicrobium sp. W14 TaxID=2817839 RepID=UPI001AE144E5|nr:ABC transporter permease [Methanomicrobium sp. W14]MBP2133052.1 ABC-type Na+ efflux pump permease subunit [Methanomicrobium sp. W14]
MNLKNVEIIAKKELKSLADEKTIILAIVLQLFIAMFSSFLLIGLASMYNPDSISSYSNVKYPVAYTGEPSEVLTYLRDSSDFVVYEMDLSTAVEALKERKLSAVLWMPDTAPDYEYPVKITLYTIGNDIQSSLVNVKLKQILLKYEDKLREIRSDRLNGEIVDIKIPASDPSGDFYEFVYGLLIPLLLFMPAIISGALIIDMITEEYQESTLETLLSTPIGFSEVVWGKTAACFILVPVQAAAWLTLLMVNGIAVAGFIPILLHISVASLVIILAGAIIALKYHERTNAQFVFSAAIVAVILIFLAFPMNTANIIVRLSVGSIGSEHWLILGIILAIAAALAYIVTGYSEKMRAKFI